MTAGRNVLICNHCFSSDLKADIIKKQFNFLETMWSVISNGFGWNYGSQFPNSYYYTRLKGDAIAFAMHSLCVVCPLLFV
jgi:hypothetical protein